MIKKSDALLADRDFVLLVLRHSHCGRLQQLVSEPFRSQTDILFTAVQHGMPLQHCPTHCQIDVDFCIAAVHYNPHVYRVLKRAMATHPVVAHAAIVAPDSHATLMEMAIRALPALLTDMAVAAAVVDRATLAFVEDLVLQH